MKNICIFISMLSLFPSVCGWTAGLRHVNISYYENKKTWEDAQSFCRKKHTDLITIRSEDNIQLFSDENTWIGLFLQSETRMWKWSGGNEIPVFENWAEHEPNQKEDGLCAYMDKSHRWFSSKCENKHPFLCYDENLVLVKENKTWEEALDHCRSLGGEDSENPVSVFDLATLITDDDHDYARERAQQAPTNEVWTGLRFLGDGWFWVGGEPVEYLDIPNCPAFGCGVLEKNSSTSFGIRACSQRRNFFCSKRPEND